MGSSSIALLSFFVWIAVCERQVFADHVNGLSLIRSYEEVWHQKSKIGTKVEELSCERPSSTYICELPPESISPDATKFCNYRNVDYHEQVYRWVAGRGCLLYTPDFLFEAGTNTINLNNACLYGNLVAPCLEIAKEDGTCGCFPFDPAFQEVIQAVSEAVLPSAHGRFERCFYAAEDCCDNYMEDSSDDSGNSTSCGATFDGWTCFAGAEADSTVQEVCSEFAYSSSGPSCNHYSSKQCNTDGTWEVQTDYSTCSITPRLVRRYRYYISILAISTAACLPAVFIFFFYKRLRVTRVILHRNLLIAIIVRNVIVMISRSEIYIDELTSTGDTVMSTHGIFCRVLALAERVMANAVFVCMLVEGVYLHRLIVAVFRRKINIGMLYGVGALIAIIPVAAWAIVMGIHNDHSCWLIYTIDHIQWILDAPRIVILLINTVLFVDITRVLVTKIRNSENVNQLNTTKATLFLLPLFGSQFLLTAFRPSTNNCTGEEVYYYVTYAVEGLQGFIVAMLYCYVNKEVQTLIKSTYKKTEQAVMRTRRDTNYRRTTLGVSTTRTYSTGFDPDDNSTASKVYTAEVITPPARLAEVLEPDYEKVDEGIENKGYDARDSGFIEVATPPALSESIDSRDWLRCVSSPTSSVYGTLNDDDGQYLESNNNTNGNGFKDRGSAEANEFEPKIYDINDASNNVEPNEDSMINEIIKEFENREIMLIPELLSPNRRAEDKIVFVDE